MLHLRRRERKLRHGMCVLRSVEGSSNGFLLPVGDRLAPGRARGGAVEVKGGARDIALCVPSEVSTALGQHNAAATHLIRLGDTLTVLSWCE